MAATNPFKVSDLIAKYGWKIMPYLSNLGVRTLAEAQVLFVDSGHTDTLDADDTEHGHSLEKPLATIDYAIGLCTASEGAIILVAPGHYEDLAAAQIDFDVAGVTCIGLGEGTLRPRIDFENTASSIDIGANNVTLINLGFRPSVTGVLIGVDVESGVTNFKMLDCEFMPGEDGSNVDEFTVCVDLKSGNNDTVIKHNVFRSQITAAPTTGIILSAASARVHIEDNVANGNFSTAFIDDGAACTDILIRNNVIKVKDGEPGIELTATTTGLIIDNKIESTGLAIDAMIVAADCAWFNNLGVNADGSAAEIIGAGESFAARVAVNPNVAFGKEYWVDADTGSDSNDGLSPGAAFATVAAAITANNTAFAADSDPQNTMYIHSKTYTESLTAFPKNCTVIGVGGKVRIQGYHSTGAAQNCRIHNVQFRSSTASQPIITVANASHGIEFHECVFDSQAAISECLLFEGSNSDIVVENCRFGYETNPTNSPDIAIRFGGVHAQRGKVISNQIYSTGIGIQIDATMSSNNFLLIKDNVIACGLGSSDAQMAIGINNLEVSPKGGLYVHNFISAVDAIYFSAANSKSQWACICNYVNQGATASREDSF